MIEVVNLTKRYGNHLAVNELSFNIEEGQIYGFLGPNGAGKTTTMNIMTGYLAPSEGTVRINGYDILEDPEEARKCIGYLPEQPPLYLDMTVLEYIKFVAGLKKLPKSERKSMIDEAINVCKLEEVKNRVIKNLSKGYKQRVGLAQAIVGLPPVIILDEPTVGLDPLQIIEIRDMIKSLGKNHTVILSSHILSEISAICDHVMIISHGKLVASDTPENLLALMKKEKTLNLTVKGSKESIEGVLRSLEFVTDIQFMDSEEKACQSLVITYEGKEDIREELFYALSNAALPIYKLLPPVHSLEDVFIELTENKEEEK
ncbi:ABC-type multidrug transport system, ATPase component [Lachnospiraceae bacterium TWA4]|nr:ABC-type multidrug transport system, ATPase component [Lachnospiraceae bacterium TWA4]